MSWEEFDEDLDVAFTDVGGRWFLGCLVLGLVGVCVVLGLVCFLVRGLFW